MVFSLLYNLLLVFLSIVLCPVWLLWMLLVPKVSVGFWQKLGFYPVDLVQWAQKTPVENRVWIHAVSVGELNAAKPLINRLLAQHYPVILSNTTATGNQLAAKTFPDLPRFFFPFDFPWVVEKAFLLFNPSLLLIMETEIWPNLLRHAAQRKIPLLLLNGRLSEKSFHGYSRFKSFFCGVLGHYTRLLMQSSDDAERMIALGVDPQKIMVAGNIKFDLPPLSSMPLQAELQALFQFPENAQVLVFASTHSGEEAILMEMAKRLFQDFPALKVVLAPRHPERAKNVATLLTEKKIAYSLRSQLSREHPHPSEVPVILLDSVGELNTVFSFSTLACMGGTFVNAGGHNPLEPINAGIPVIFGPSMGNFKEITQQVLRAEAGIQVDSIETAEQHIRRLLTQPEYYQKWVQNGEKLMSHNRGVADMLIAHIEQYLPHKAALLR
jgi:3-deoxy-D-manno-octulosonic-acid transferase